MRTAVMTALVLVSFVMPMPSQSADNLCPSRVVRWSVNDHLVEGSLLEAPVAGQPLKVQRSGMSATQKELAWDTPSLACQIRRANRGRAGMIGFVAGASAGGFLGLVEGDDTGWCFVLCSAGEKAMAYGLSLGIIGAAVGAMVEPGSVWRSLNSTTGTWPIGLVANAHGVGVQIRF